MPHDGSTVTADAVSPIVAPGDMPPDQADAIPTEHDAGDVTPIDAPAATMRELCRSIGPRPAADAEPRSTARTAAPAASPSPAFAVALRAETKKQERGDTIPAGQLLAIAASNATPRVPSDVIDADDDALARHMLAMGHLTEAELAWIMADPRPSFPPTSSPIAAAPAQAVGGQSGFRRAMESPRIEAPVARRPAPGARRTGYSGYGRR